MNELTERYLSSCIPIVIEKSCGYTFLFYLNEYATLVDLYRYVEQFYNHCNQTKVLYQDKLGYNIIIRNNTRLKDYIMHNKIQPSNKLPEKCLYKFYLTFI